MPVVFNASLASVTEFGLFVQLMNTVTGSTTDADSYYFGSGIRMSVTLEVSSLVFTSVVFYRQAPTTILHP